MKVRICKLSVVTLFLFLFLFLSLSTQIYAKNKKQHKNKVYYECLLTKNEQDYIRKESKKNKISFDLVMKLISCESGFNKNARSATNDSGLMQLNDCVKGFLFQNCGITNTMDWKQNVKGGCFILGRLRKLYGSNEHKILMAYNFGEGRMRRLWREGVKSSVYSRKIKSVKLKRLK